MTFEYILLKLRIRKLKFIRTNVLQLEFFQLPRTARGNTEGGLDVIQFAIFPDGFNLSDTFFGPLVLGTMVLMTLSIACLK